MIFDVVHLESWTREAEYSQDMTTFLWWKHQIVVSVVLNVDATSAGLFPPVAVAPDPKVRGPVGAPGQARNAEARDAGGGAAIHTPNNPKWESVPSPAVGKDRTDLKPGDFGFDPEPEVDPPAIKADPGFGGGGDFALPPPAGGQGVNGSVQFPLPGGPDVPFFGGGAFGGGKQKPGGKPFIRFGPGRGAAPNQPNPRGPARLRRAAPTVPPTDVEIRQRLRRPRRQLMVWLNSGPGGAAEFMLLSPVHPQAECDAQQGPLCTVLDVPEVHGETTAVMRLAFVTWEAPPVEWTTVEPDTSDRRNEFNKQLADLDRAQGVEPNTPEAVARRDAYTMFWREALAGDTPEAAVAAAERAARKAGAALNQAQQAARNAAQAFAAAAAVPAPARRALATPAMLSNRWTMSFGWDPDTHMRTQTVEGEVTFRMDVLRLRGLTADQLRRQFWHPVPLGYRRRPLGKDDVAQSPDGASIKYRCVDEEQLMNFPGGLRHGIIDADVAQSMTVGIPNKIGLPGLSLPLTKVTAAEPS